jgi:predicted ATPase/class 3 adenylate cyclase
MFCDLVESTQLTELLDPEELHLVISAYQNMCFHVVSRFEGYTAQYLGDGLLMYFGYPQAHEDDAARAVRAGLEIVTELHQLNLRLQDEVVVLRHRPLQIRVGIHTGLVVVSEMGKGERRELMALGEAPNVANRLQMIAEPNSVVLSAVTQRLTEGLFSCQPLGLRTLRGVSTPMPVYRVLHEQDIRNRFEIAVSRGLTPLIGRERPLELLLQVWGKAQAGVGQVVLLKGEAGIGKSRLVQSLKDRLMSDAHLRLEYHCSPYHQHSALYPIIDLFQRLLGFSREDTAEQKLQKLEKVLHDAESGFSFPSLDPTEVRLLLAALLSIPLPENSSMLHLTPQRQKQKILDLLSDWVIARAATQPLLVIVEDLHWADPSTLELLSLVFDRQPTARMLIVLTFRPDFTLPWSQNDRFSLLSLSRLSRAQVETMIHSLVGGKSLPPEVVNQIVLRTDGVPLFVEELTKTILESGLLRENAEGYELIGVLPSGSIPATLQDSLMARLDRLGAAKELAQLAAVVGREFSYELLQALVADESNLLRGLQQLTDAELVYQPGAPPGARYFFKHALVRDAAYQSLLKSKRKQLHTQIAQVLEARFPEIVDTHPELLAHHYTQAEHSQSAIHYWREAGLRASARAAHAEAIQHFSAALNLLPQLPEEAERDRIELTVQVQLGLSWAARKGYAASEVEHTYNRARDLCARLGESADLFPVVRGLCTFYIVRDEQKTARELAEQCLRLAQATRNETYLIEGYTALGYVACYQGELETATAALQEGVTLYNRHKGEQLSFLTPQDPGVACLSLLALVRWLQGETEQALRCIHEARVLAQQLKQPFNVTYVYAYEAMLHQLLRQPVEAAESARAAIDISEKYGFDVWRGAGVLHLGIAKGGLGEHEEGITLIRQTLAAWRAGGAELLRPYFLAGLGEAYLAAGQYEEAMMAVSEALAHVERYGERFYESTLYRLRGEARLARVAAAWGEAEADFQSAIAIAGAQKAKALELRATISLSRCLHARGKQDDARRLLYGVLRQFPQRENSLDVREARGLLAELG